jgi:hypothetical protein
MDLIIISIAVAAAATQPSGDSCRRTHIFEDGHVETSQVPDDGHSASATSASSSRSASSHVAASSSSAGASSSSTSTATSTADGRRSSVTVSRGPEGCKIVIDDRP